MAVLYVGVVTELLNENLTYSVFVFVCCNLHVQW